MAGSSIAGTTALSGYGLDLIKLFARVVQAFNSQPACKVIAGIPILVGPPKVFDMVKNLGKICENLRKIPENIGKFSNYWKYRQIAEYIGKYFQWKYRQKWRRTCFYLKKWCQLVQNHMKTSFWSSSQGRSLWENNRTKSDPNFSSKFGEIRAKILRTSKNLLARTPMLVISSN